MNPTLSVLCALPGLLMFAGLSLSKNSPPKVDIYSRFPGNFDKPNILICHVSGFHPPELDLELLEDGVVMPEANQTDLAFEEDWYYHMTKHVDFIPKKGREYSCKVIHLGVNKQFHWEPDN